MSITHEETIRATKLLGHYKSRISKEDDENLHESMERLMEIFSSDLFKALIDIERYYEQSLTDGERVLTQEEGGGGDTGASLGASGAGGGATPATAAAIAAQRQLDAEDDGDRAPPPSVKPKTHHQQLKPVRAAQREEDPDEVNYENLQPGPPIDILAAADAAAGVVSVTDGMEEDPIETETIVLHKPPNAGFGFTIAGGTDQPAGGAGADPAVLITRVVPDGCAWRDGRLRVDDVVASVNRRPLHRVTHEEAVAALKAAGQELSLEVSRVRGAPRPQSVADPVTGQLHPAAQQPPPIPLQPPPHPAAAAAAPAPAAAAPLRLSSGFTAGELVEVAFAKGVQGLGFSIAGGVGNEHVPGSNGIFITKVTPGGAAEHTGRVNVGDRLMRVDGHSCEAVTHDDAVATLKSTGRNVTMHLLKPDGEVNEEGIPLDIIDGEHGKGGKKKGWFKRGHK